MSALLAVALMTAVVCLFVCLLVCLSVVSDGWAGGDGYLDKEDLEKFKVCKKLHTYVRMSVAV